MLDLTTRIAAEELKRYRKFIEKHLGFSIDAEALAVFLREEKFRDLVVESMISVGTDIGLLFPDRSGYNPRDDYYKPDWREQSKTRNDEYLTIKGYKENDMPTLHHVERFKEMLRGMEEKDPNIDVHPTMTGLTAVGYKKPKP